MSDGRSQQHCRKPKAESSRDTLAYVGGEGPSAAGIKTIAFYFIVRKSHLGEIKHFRSVPNSHSA